MIINRIEFEQKYKVNVADATDTGCPLLQHINVWCKECGNYDLSFYIAIGVDPCPLKKCGLSVCRNYGKPYDKQERLILI